MKQDTSGRVLPIAAGNMMQPASCATCGKSAANSREKFADPQIYIEFFGNVYFCKQCALELAATFEAYTKEEFTAAAEQRDQLLVHNATLHSRVQELENTVDGLSRSWLSSRSLSSSSDIELDFDEGAITEAISTDGGRPKSATQDGTGQSTEPNQSGTDEGSTDTSRTDPDFDHFIKRL